MLCFLTTCLLYLPLSPEPCAHAHCSCIVNPSTAPQFSTAFNSAFRPTISLGTSPDVEALSIHFNSTCLTVIDTVAPLKTRVSKPRSEPPRPLLAPLHMAPPSLLHALLFLNSLPSLRGIIGHMKPAGSPHDPLSLCLFKEVFPNLSLDVLSIINGSLTNGIVPVVF